MDYGPFEFRVGYGLWVYNATFNDISVVSYGEKTTVRPVASHWQTLLHKVVSSTPHQTRDSNTQLVVIGTDGIGRFKSNYITITISESWV